MPKRPREAADLGDDFGHIPRDRDGKISGPGVVLSGDDVDLVLDVGNSRTCGLLIEAAGELGVNLNDSYELALRDLSHPESVHNKPFESRVEFAQAWFGKNHLSRMGGRAATDSDHPAFVSR